MGDELHRRPRRVPEGSGSKRLSSIEDLELHEIRVEEDFRGEIRRL